MRDFRHFVRSKVGPLALPPPHEQKIVDEWAATLEDIYDALRADGVSDEDAWREIERQVPAWPRLGTDLLADRLMSRQGVRSRPVMRLSLACRVVARRARDLATRGTLGDLHAGLRQVRKSPGFTAAVVLTLAACIGANAAIFTVIETVLLRPLPVPEPERIVGLGDVYPTITPNDILSNDVPSYFDRREALTTLEEQGMFRFWFDTFTIDGIPQELRGVRATPSLFRVLRVAPALGRAFSDAEGEIGAEHKIILSHALWQQLYGGDPDVIGRSLRLAWTGQSYTIVGVMPREFTFFDQGYPGHAGALRTVQFWIPLAFTPEQRTEAARTRYGFFHVARLRPGATVERVQAQLDALQATYLDRFPQFRYAELSMYSLVTPLQDAFTRDVRRPLYLLWGGAAVVLLIGVFNLINLSLARAHARQRELATRVALGAARVRIMRQLVIEALVPAALGGAAGLAISAAILKALTQTGLQQLPNAVAVGVNASTGAFVTMITLLVGVMMGLVPAATAGTVKVNRTLAEHGRSETGGRATRLFRRSLIVVQVALSVVLLFAATLLITSFRHLLTLDAGFTPTGVVTATIFPPPSRYPNSEALTALQDRVLERVRAIPGIQAAGLTSNIAMSGYESPATVSTTLSPSPDAPTMVPSVIAITPGYFSAMATALVGGRDFRPDDRADTARVAIVDEALARRLWPDEDPLGKAIYRGDLGPFTVVGIVREMRYEGLTGSIDPIGTAYFPYTQAPPLGRLRWLAVKSSADPRAVVSLVRAALLEIDPDLPLSDIQTMSERTAHTLVAERLASDLATMFAAVALLLSMLGIYAVLASVVAGRTREIGIRMALGSTVRRVFHTVLAEGAVVIGAGVALGLGGALAAARAFDGLVHGVQPTNARILIAVAVATGSVALLACVAPARRAARVNPVDVLAEP